MLLWENTENNLVKLCNEFRKAVVVEFTKNPELAAQLMGAYTSAELKEFEYMSAQALEEVNELKAQLAQFEMGNTSIEAQLDRIVMDMSEESTKMALSVLGEDTLKKFITSLEGATQETSDKFAALNYPNLAKLFSPK
jgi:hypothetical protein